MKYIYIIIKIDNKHFLKLKYVYAYLFQNYHKIKIYFKSFDDNSCILDDIQEVLNIIKEKFVNVDEKNVFETLFIIELY
jgi:hypothetical protein